MSSFLKDARRYIGDRRGYKVTLISTTRTCSFKRSEKRKKKRKKKRENHKHVRSSLKISLKCRDALERDMFNSKPRDYLYECAKSGRRYITSLCSRQHLYRKTLGESRRVDLIGPTNQAQEPNKIHTDANVIITFPVAAIAGSPFARCADARPFVFPSTIPRWSFGWL